MDAVNLVIQKLPVFMLALARVTPVFVAAPFFGNRFVPVQWRVAVSLGMAWFITVVHPAVAPAGTGNLWVLAGLSLRELAVGGIIAFAFTLAVSVAQVAGQLIDFQAGFSLATALNPNFDAQLPVVANFYYIVALLLFLVTNAYQLALAALWGSLQVVPLGQAVFRQDLLPGVLTMFSELFALGVQLALPVVAVLFLADVALAILSRAVPQLNVLFMGMPLKAGAAVLLVAITIPATVLVLRDLFSGLANTLPALLKTVGP